MNVLTFLRDVGKNFSMTPLVQRDYIAQRMGEGGAGISYTEFSYTLLQGYDYLHLNQTYGVNLQLSGSDQWGNCISGVDLIRRTTGEEVHILTMPLIINKATGRKFGKSEEGAVWLDEKKTSVYKFYQFWINADDEGVEDYLKIYTDLEKSEIEGIIEQHELDRSKRIGQKRLAIEVTSIVHGKEAAARVMKISEDLFSNNYQEWKAVDFDTIIDAIPYAVVEDGADLLTILVDTNLASSKTEARRFVGSGAVKIFGRLESKTGISIKLE